MRGTGGALAYLLGRSMINRARAWVRRITTPRYAAAFLVGAGYLYAMLGRSRFPGAGAPPAAGSADFVPLFYEAAVVFAVILTWVLGAAEPGIYFTPADIQMLFPAPVSRPALVRYKLAQAQLPILFTVLVMRTLIKSTSPVLALGRAPALWVVVTTLYLHRVGASFVKVSAAQRGLSGLRRNALPIAIVLLAFATFIWGIVDALPAIEVAFDRNSIQGVLTAVHSTPQARIVLWPFDTLVAPLTAHTAAERFRTMGVALLLMLGCYVWVMRSAVGFEEAAMQSAERMAARIARVRGRSTVPLRAWRPLFRLSASGRPYGAIVWKNLTAFQRLASPRRTILFAVFTVLLATAWMRTSATAASMVTGIAGGGIFWLAFFGAIAVRADLQQDMLKLQLLRTYPMRSATLVAAEIGGSLIVISAIQGFLILCALLGFAFMPVPPHTEQSALIARGGPKLLALVIALPAITGLRVSVANAWAVLFPSWVQLGPTKTAGIEAIGANMLTVFGSLLVHLLLMALPLALGYGLMLALNVISHGAWTYVPAAIVFSTLSAVELWLISKWLGYVFSRTDPSAVDAALS